MKLSEFLFENRLNECKGLAEYANIIGINYVTYWKLERGTQKTLQGKTLAKLVKKYNLTPKEIMEMINEDNEQI